MKKLFLVLSIIFAILTFTGAGYALLNDGQPSAGYAVIPLVSELACVSMYRNCKKKEEYR